ncbi:MAG: SIMPL domain-containing protein [Nocardioidaceae bacterium]|nr:SIMPL domain-containing protein [Nocardioidaceae bacterium]
MDHTVTVTGSGVTLAVPDSAVLQVGAGHRASDLATALDGMTSALDVMASVARDHTEPRLISSTDLQVWPAYDDQGRPDGFEARHGLRITVPDLATAGRLVSALAAAVGDRLRVDSVTLEVADRGEALTTAREAAFADARARAEHLAALGGLRLGALVQVVEGGMATPRPMVLAAASRAAKDVSFQAGEQAVTADLAVTWELVGAPGEPRAV